MRACKMNSLCVIQYSSIVLYYRDVRMVPTFLLALRQIDRSSFPPTHPLFSAMSIISICLHSNQAVDMILYYLLSLSVVFHWHLLLVCVCVTNTWSVRSFHYCSTAALINSRKPVLLASSPPNREARPVQEGMKPTVNANSKNQA